MTSKFPYWPVLLILGWLYIITPGKIAGMMFPVVGDVEMQASMKVDDPKAEWVDVSGSFDKYRDACRPLRLEWHLGTREYPGPPIAYVWGKPEVRSSGLNTFDDWLVRGAPVSVFDYFTYADVLHKCGFTIPLVETRVEFPWETRTKFWN